MDVVVFIPARFRARYPQFAAVSDERLQIAFDDATIYVSNKPTSIVKDLTERDYLLSLVMAHMLQLAGVTTAEGEGSTAGQVGRLASASEGSVSASFAMDAVSGGAAWYAQTQYGLTYWAATSKYRRFRYIAPSCRN